MENEITLAEMEQICEFATHVSAFPEKVTPRMLEMFGKIFRLAQYAINVQEAQADHARAISGYEAVGREQEATIAKLREAVRLCDEVDRIASSLSRHSLIAMELIYKARQAVQECLK